MAQEGTRSGLVVVIPTTDAPIVVKQLTWLAKVPLSRVVLASVTSDECRRWSVDYNSLLRQGDPFRSLLDLPESGCYRMVATGDIDLGKSWMTPVAAAHFGLAQGEAPTLDMAKARLMVWGTGAIDLSVAATAQAASMVSADYHLTTKIDRSRQLFAEAAHADTPVLCLVPAGEEADKAVAVLSKVLARQPHHIAVAESLADVIGPLDAYLRTGVFETPAPPPAPDPKNELTIVPKPPERRSTGATADGTSGAKPSAGGASAAGPSSARGASEPSTGADGVIPPGNAGRGSHAVTPPPPRPRPVWMRPAGLALLGVAAAGVAFAGYALVAPGDLEPSANTTPAAGPSVQEAALQPAAPPAAPIAPDVAKPALFRLVLLTPPKGVDCRSVFYDAGKKYVETQIEAPDGPGSLPVDAAGLCGLRLIPGAAVGARFQKGTGPQRVESQSNAQKIIFNPTALGGGVTSLPAVEIDQPRAAQIALTPR